MNHGKEQAKNYHGHPNYFYVWLSLMALFLLSLGVGEFGNRNLAISLVFVLAIVKAILVFGSFMHLRWEPKLLSGVIAFAFLCLVMLYFGVVPDLLPVPLHVVSPGGGSVPVVQ